MFYFALSVEMAEAMSGAAKVKVGALGSFDEDGIRWLDEELERALDHDYPDWKNPSTTHMTHTCGQSNPDIF